MAPTMLPYRAGRHTSRLAARLGRTPSPPAGLRGSSAPALRAARRCCAGRTYRPKHAILKRFATVFRTVCLWSGLHAQRTFWCRNCGQRGSSGMPIPPRSHSEQREYQNGCPLLLSTAENTHFPKGFQRFYPGVVSWRRRMCYTCDRCLLYTSPSPRDATLSRMPSSA